MRPLFSILLLCLLTVLFISPSRSSAQRARLGKVHALQATSDKGGEHPASTEISGPATVTCFKRCFGDSQYAGLLFCDRSGIYRSLE